VADDASHWPGRLQLQDLRAALVDLHKTLVDSERVSYERTLGPIASPNRLLQLLMEDPWFAWLHRLSMLIVAIDQALDSRRQPLTEAHAADLIQTVRELLVASPEGKGFARHYDEALQRDPGVVMAHARVVRLFAARRSRN
jgi:hypothetical protein